MGVTHRLYENADFRIFDFADGDDVDGGELVEWELTEKKGGGLGKSPKGVHTMGVDDYPKGAEGDVVHEATNEEPSL